MASYYEHLIYLCAKSTHVRFMKGEKLIIKPQPIDAEQEMYESGKFDREQKYHQSKISR